MGVLLNPGFGVSAGWAYSHFDGRSHATADSMAIIAAALARHELAALADAVVNDLEPGVARTHAVIGEMRKALRAAGARAVFMSGSGPTVCGLFQDSAEAQRGAASLAEHPLWAVIPFSTLSYRPLVARQG
jgi:4-diphosphocytidyl-2-C-methyl-D-erythritol kinase